MRREKLSPGHFIGDFDRDAVFALNKLLNLNPRAEIVISSDWKRHISLEQMQEFYRAQGIHRVPIGYTPIFTCTTRAQAPAIRAKEILSYVNIHNLCDWIAIDDLDLGLYLPRDNFVRTDPEVGLMGFRMRMN